MSTITRYILWCLDNIDKDQGKPALENEFKRALSMLWERSGHPAPDDLKVSVGEPGPDGRIPLSIEMAPPTRVLPSGKRVELEFAW